MKWLGIYVALYLLCLPWIGALVCAWIFLIERLPSQ